MDKNKYEDMITKSIDEIDALAESFKSEEEEIKKSKLSPDEVSDDAEYGGEEGSEVDRDEDDEDEETESTLSDDDEDYEKSLTGELGGNDNVKKALEVSEFLEELVKGLDSVPTSRTDGIKKSILETTDNSNNLLAKSVQGLARAQKAVLETNVELLKSLRAVNSRVDQLQAQPVVRKSANSASDVIDKSFQASAGNAPERNISLSKSQASAKLTAEFEAGNAELLNDILALEGTGDMESISDTAKNILGL